MEIEKTTIPVDLFSQVVRLKRITGFATTLYTVDDRRPLFFSRLYHVFRVSLIANWISEERLNIGAKINVSLVNWLAWAHDLNRWPFAHNSEKNNKTPFHQSENLEYYFEQQKISVSPETMLELSNILDKKVSNLSEEGRIVLLSDMVAGFFEDPLLAIIGLDLTPDIIPEKVIEALDLPFGDLAFHKHLFALNQKLFFEKNGELLLSDFNSLFESVVKRFLTKYELHQKDGLNSKWFEVIRETVKENFLRPIIFPYNNEKIAKGDQIRLKLIYKLEKSVLPNLTIWDEPDLINFAMERKLIDAADFPMFLPSLDFIYQHEPQNSFRKNFNLNIAKM